MEQLTFSLLGAPQIWLGDQSLTQFVHKKSYALLIYLAVTGRMHTRDSLATLFWPETNNTRARKNLRDILPEVRRALGAHITITAQTIALDFRRAIELDSTLLQAGLKELGPQTNLNTLQTAVTLYKGEFLEGFHLNDAPLFENWATQQREQLYELVVAALDLLAERHWTRHAYSEGLLVTRRLLALEPWREQAHRQQMRFLAASGNKYAALAQYKTCQTILAEELGVEPRAATTALYEQIRDDNQAEQMALAVAASPAFRVSLSPHPLLPLHNLPRQFTPLIGRQMEITTLRNKVIGPDNALLTLVGEGGIGKTRLAIAVGEAVLSHFPDGVWFVPLVGVTPGADSEDRLATAIGEALKFSFTGAEPLANQLFARLRAKQLLLVLDNFEQLVDNAGFILALLRAAQGVKALVTSRRLLNLQAEVLFELDGLRVPEESDPQWLARTQLLDYESVALFVEHASRTYPAFRLEAEDPGAILRICRHVAGSPLGIELAATLVEQQTCGRIADALRDNYAILASTQHDLPARQRSMQASLAYSWHFLSSAEAHVLTLCAVFYGNFSLAAAQAVTQATPEMLARLVAQSLLYEPEPERYAMHELVRQHATEQLQQMPAAEQMARNQHCEYFATFLANQVGRLRSASGAQQMVRAKLDNIRAAWQWAIDHTKLSALKKGMEGLYQFYYLAGFYHEGEVAFQQAAACVEALLARLDQSTLEDQRLLAGLRLAQSGFCNALAQLDEASRLARTVIGVGQSLADLSLELKGYQRLGEAAFSSGDYAMVRTCAEKALAIARRRACRN